MEYISYQMVSSDTGSLNTGSYLNRTEASLFSKGVGADLWYGFSANDAIELGVFDRNKNLIGWQTVHHDATFRDITLSYLDGVDVPVTYSYSELIPPFPLFKNEKVLVDPVSDLSASFGILDGSYTLIYNFTREMAGSPREHLVIKEVSPSRTELKIVPLGTPSPTYTAFCQKKVLVKDVSPLYLLKTKNFAYSNVYAQIYQSYVAEINTLKMLFFLNSDGEVVNFLKNLYEDFIIYTNPPATVGKYVSSPERVSRVQGIRTFFHNFLLSHSNDIIAFEEIDAQYLKYVVQAVERKFIAVGKHPAKEFVDAKKFVMEFFLTYFYKPITELLRREYFDKYFSYLKNALNLGNGLLLPILDHGMMDERAETIDPLTLLLKLHKELPNDISTQTECWVSNISLAPFVINAIVRNPLSGKLIRIGDPNFNVVIPNVSVSNENRAYSADDLTNDSNVERELTVSRNLTDLNINYGEFKNFVVFSSAELRLKIFKNKIIQITNLSGSLSTLDARNVTFLAASGSTYPFYETEADTIEDQMNSVVNSFDGYESHLYRNGYYTYDGGTFVSASYIEELELSGSTYDKYNRDSLINNTPEHILTSADNDEYIVFLSMVGHFFDETYAYISNLPMERKIGHGSTEEFTRKVVDQMLETFGWKLDDTLEQSNFLDTYLTSTQVPGLNSMSAEDRLKTIRNRLLLNLPSIYKSKGTEAAVRMLLSCHGIPNSLLSIREYGGVNYSGTEESCTQYERAYLYKFDPSVPTNQLRLGAIPNLQTLMFKFVLDDPYHYTSGQEMTVVGNIEANVAASTMSGSGVWAVGFVRGVDFNSGRVFFRLGYKGRELAKIVSDPLPIFDGNVYSVMVRKNDPDPYFEYTPTTVVVPTKYDLFVKRHEGGRLCSCSTQSMVVYNSTANSKFTQGATTVAGGWFLNTNGSIPLKMSFDKLQLWADEVEDKYFDDYVNYINSYSYTGDYAPEEALIYRMHVEYPLNLNQIAAGYDAQGEAGVNVTTTPIGFLQNGNPYYASGSIDKLNGAFGELGFTRVDRMICVNPWSGSQELVYNTSSCSNVSQSTFPFQYQSIDYPCTYVTSRYGPNKFRNEKITHLTQSYEVRFDQTARSTFIPRSQIAPDSNQVGFFVDPQDFKNKDIIRYFGNFNFMDVIGDPGNNFSSSYDGLRALRKQYSDSKANLSGSKTLFNEIQTLYRIYFNRSVFDSIKNLVPARTNAIVGVLIEPTILERPKYESKPIVSELNSGSVVYFDVTASRYFRDPNTKLVRITQSLQYGNFNLDTSLFDNSASFDTSSLPQNLESNMDVSYINNPSFGYPANFAINGTYIPDCPDLYQLGHFGTSQNMSYVDLTTGKIPFDQSRDVSGNVSSSCYLLRRWQKYSIYFKSGSWVRSENRSENLYTTASIHLYDYVVVSKEHFDDVVYTASLTSYDDPYGPSEVHHMYGSEHYANTFKFTANSKFDNIHSTPFQNGFRISYWTPYFPINDGTYFEIVEGYPRNHISHKRAIFSLYTSKTVGVSLSSSGSYRRNSQTISTTVGVDGLESGMPPVEYIDVGNVTVVQSNNVINH